MSGDMVALREKLEGFLNKRVGPFESWNPVNEGMVWQWLKAMGDDNTAYTEQGYAPPTMLQMWTMRDVNGDYAPGSTDANPFALLPVMDEAGFNAIMAVEYDQTYFRYLKPGDKVKHYSSIVSMSEMKSTGLGEGFFFTELAEYFDAADEKFGEARITYFKYKAPEAPKGAKQAAQPDKVLRTHPVENYDSEHYWQGLRDGKVLIQKCSSCGTLRHPPSPMCRSCQSLEWETVEASGQGTLYSYTTLHYPHIPPFDYPNIIGLIDLAEGVRMVAQMTQMKPEELEIGMAVQVVLEEVQDDLVLPLFKPAA